MANGHCNCGLVHFEFEGAPAGVYICHCSICRRSSGANGIAVVLVPSERFKWTQGEEHIIHWRKPESEWETWFCGTCGSRLPGHNDKARMFIPAGLLPDLDLKVQAHIWVDSRAEWDEIGGHATQFSERFGGPGND